MRMNATLAIRAIKDLTGLSVILNRDPAASPAAKCQAWFEKGGSYHLLASGRSWEAVISSLRRKATEN
jgi:hypothetical protein